MLSVFLITRNEEASLTATLRSVAPVADELVVIDTGSTDRTAAIAREAGAVVHDFPWSDDFSAARNFAISKTAGDWLLCLDSDEEILPPGHDLIRAAIARPDALGFTVRWQNLVDPARPDFFTEMQPLRLMRRVPYARFIGRIHEHVDPPIEEIMRREGRQVFPSDITLRHTGYIEEKKRAKLQRAAHLLKLELRERPGQLYYEIEYGKTLLQLGDTAGHEILAQASRRVWPLRHEPCAPMQLVAALLEYCLTASLTQPSNPLTPGVARRLARRWFPDSPPLLWLQAQQAFAAGQFAAAADLLERLVACGKTGKYDSALSFDPRILGDDALLNLGVCRLRLAQLDQAEACFRQIPATSPRAGEAQQNLAVLRALASCPGAPESPGASAVQ